MSNKSAIRQAVANAMAAIQKTAGYNNDVKEVVTESFDLETIWNTPGDKFPLIQVDTVEEEPQEVQPVGFQMWQVPLVLDLKGRMYLTIEQAKTWADYGDLLEADIIKAILVDEYWGRLASDEGTSILEANNFNFDRESRRLTVIVRVQIFYTFTNSNP